MKKQAVMISILILIFCISFLGCEAMATLFHGPRPEDPPVTYTVTFYANEATGTPPATKTVNAGSVISLPNKEGLSKGSDIFAGWSESPNGGTIYPPLASVTVNGDMVFYAQWLDSSTPQYTVTFDRNGATGGSPPSSQTVYSGMGISIPNHGTLSYSGKSFGGWNTLSNGGGLNYTAGTIYTVTGHTTLYAKWQSEIQYTVTYNANGASGTPPAVQTVDPGTVITLPEKGNLTASGRIFNGWNTQANGSGASYAEGAMYTVNANASFYAQWVSEPIDPNAVIPQGSTLAEKLAYIRSDMGDGTVFDVVVNSNEYIGPQTVATMGRNITVYIRSANPADIKFVQLEGQGHLLSVDSSITLKLHDIVMRGTSTNNKPLVVVATGGTLILNSGAKITANHNDISSPDHGGGILVNGGVLELNDGSEIVGNQAYSNRYGGGIYVHNSGTVTIRGGLISENKASFGGGIYVTGNSTVTMSGGIISKNQAVLNRGGGVHIDNGSFTKRAILESSTSGIIYGGTGNDANIAQNNNGHAICRNFGTLRNRNITLGGYDEISSGNDVGWE